MTVSVKAKKTAKTKAAPLPLKKSDVAVDKAAVRTKSSVAKAGKAAAVAVAATPRKAAAVPREKAAAAPGAAVKARLNRRSTETIAKILDTTGEIILESGADRISILDVCEKTGIARGTFYRYFSSQEELLDAFSRHKRDQFHATLQAVAASSQDPDERFQAVLTFVDHYLENSRARRLLLVAPDYATRWFQRIFSDSVHRFQDILSITFDAWEQRRGITIDRELVCELLVRFILSDVLVPAGAERRDLMRRIERFIGMLLSGRLARR